MTTHVIAHCPSTITYRVTDASGEAVALAAVEARHGFNFGMRVIDKGQDYFDVKVYKD